MGPEDARTREALEARQRAVDGEMAEALRELLGPSARVPAMSEVRQEAAWSQQLG